RIATGRGDIVLGGLADVWGAAPGPALVAGQVLPPLNGPLRDRLASLAGEIGAGEPYWRNAFATLSPVELPYPQKPDAVRSGPPQQLRAQIRLGQGQTPGSDAMTVAAFFAWLSALTGQQRISMLYSDSVLSARADGVECWLSPWVPLTLETPPQACAQQAAARATDRIASIHQAGPCPRDLPSRRGSRGSAQRWGQVGISLNGAAAPAGTDLALVAGMPGQGLELVANAAVFSNQTLELMASHLAVFLAAFQGTATLAELSLLPDGEVRALALMNATATDYDATLGVHEAIAAQAARTPHRAAVSFQGQTLSYRELDDQAAALAARLTASGVAVGDVVGLCLERGPDLVVGVLAILKTGAAYLPLDPEYPHDRLLYMIEDSGAARVVTCRSVTTKLAIPAEKVFLVEGPDLFWNPEFPPDTSSAPARSRRAAYLIYTSGSTGRPKGVVVTHRNVLNFFAGLDARIPHNPPGRWIAVTSLCFDISVLELCWTLTRGFTIVLHSNALPSASVAQTMVQEQVTHLQCTPSMASMLVADTTGRQALSRLSALLVGGEALSLKLAAELRALVPGSLFNMYGPTETTVWSTACDLERIGDFVPLGQPIANTRLSIRTPAGAECPALVAGELLIGGEGVSDGYWQRPELTSERFIADSSIPGARFYRTGDLVRRHPDGALEFLGRIDHQVKIRGHRIELGEIESVLLRQPGVKDAVVVAHEEAAGDWSLAAYVTAQANHALDTENIRRGMAEKLTAIMVPRAIRLLHAFPLTPNGKVDRRALPPVTPKARDACAQLPPTPLEKTIAVVWERVLGQQDIAASDNFFALGGSFFLAVQVRQQLREACGREISLPDMVHFPTPSALAAHLGEDTTGALAVAGASAAQFAGSTGSAGTPAIAHPAGSETLQALNAVESAIAGIWRDLLGIEDIGLQDDFFALGGHSLTAVRLFAQVRKQFGVDLPLATLLQAPSLAGFAAVVARNRPLDEVVPETGPWSALVPICTGRPDRQPLFCVHSAGGNVLNYKPLSSSLGPDQPFYALQAQGVDGHLAPLPTIEAMAAQYVEAIRSVDPVGPYRLVGYSSGGVIALEMARQLQRAGAGIALLAMIDTLAPAAGQHQPSRLKKLWLMRQWSLSHVLQWRERRRQ
ncbi:MAG: MelG protein (non-ribosomal peptide synthetase)-like protein, partial [Polaromonas sp.]|nr:MelG protein (non-ribosomal peptide synthetase)-like protein [Polaromonas sp.]